MKHLMMLMALVVAVTAGAQGTTIHEYPWNPDSNNDNLIGINDLLDFLPVFGDEFGNPPEPCTYDGTPLEEWWSQALTGEIIVDSMFFEFLLTDSSLVYYPGCPEPVLEIVEFAWNDMTTDISIGTSAWGGTSLNCNAANSFVWQFDFSPVSGEFAFVSHFGYLSELGFNQDGIFGFGGYSRSDEYALPLPTGWYLDEEGIHIESGWDEGDWPYYANHLHILPYWHYAE